MSYSVPGQQQKRMPVTPQPPLRTVLSELASDFALLYFLGAVAFSALSAYGGLLFIDTETALVVETLLDDDAVIESIESEAGESAPVSPGEPAARRLSIYSSTTPKRLAGLLITTFSTPLAGGALGIFAFHAYKAVLSTASVGRKKAAPGHAGGAAGAGKAADAASLKASMDAWRWARCDGIMRAWALVFALLGLGMVCLAVLGAVTFFDDIMDVVCRQESLCHFVRKTDASYRHVQSLDASGLEAVTTALGVLFVSAPLAFAVLFCALALRSLALRSIVLARRSKAARGSQAARGSSAAQGKPRPAAKAAPGANNRLTAYQLGGKFDQQLAHEAEADDDEDYDDDEDDAAEDLGAIGGMAVGQFGQFGGHDDERAPLISAVPSKRALRGVATPHRHRKNKTKLGVLFFVFVVFYPLIFLLALALPDSFSDISATPWSSSLSSASLSSSFPTRSLGGFCDQHLDLVAFYAFIYGASLVGIASQLNDALRRFLLRRSKLVQAWAPAFMPFSVSNLGAVLFLLVAGLMAAEAYYYLLVHDFPRMAGSKLPVLLERTGRVLGSLCKVSWGLNLTRCFFSHRLLLWSGDDDDDDDVEEEFIRPLPLLVCWQVMLGLLMLPVTRNSVWSVAFGLSREAMVRDRFQSCYQESRKRVHVRVRVNMCLPPYIPPPSPP